MELNSSNLFLILSRENYLPNFYRQIIGDKTGATAALTMKRSISAVDDVHRLEKTAGAKVRIIHVVRNPFDNIATMVLRNKKVRARYGQHKVKVRMIKIVICSHIIVP